MGIEKIVNYEDIGDVIYRKNNKAKNVAIRINAEGIVKVTVPGWCSYHKAESFVFDKRKWISKKLLQIERKNEENLVWKKGDSLGFFNGVIVFVESEDENYHVLRKNSEYKIAFPVIADTSSEQHSMIVRDLIGQISAVEAKKQLPFYLRELSDRVGLPYKRLTIRRMKTRWGSCSSKDNISLSSGLMFIPEELIEYVCLHELAHTIHRNHSKDFWNFLQGILPDALERRKKLRNYSLMV